MDNETKFIELLQAARKPNDKDCLASDFLRHIIKEHIPNDKARSKLLLALDGCKSCTMGKPFKIR